VNKTMLVVAAMALGVVASAADKPDPRALMDEATALRKLPGSEAVSTLTIYNAKGQARVRKTAIVSKLYDGGETEKRLVRFLSPADVKGTSLLTYDHEKEGDAVWLYLPALRKTRRIVSSEQSKSFMGSEFSYADMNIPSLDDFSYRLLGEETTGGVATWKIEMKAKTDEIADVQGYSKRVVWVGKSDHVVRRAEYYDFGGQVFKVMTASDIRELDTQPPRHRAFRLEVVNEENGRRSTLEIGELEVSPDVKDDYFTTRYLERI
jgi:outer membrane lipoprotein-sorting protein